MNINILDERKKLQKPTHLRCKPLNKFIARLVKMLRLAISIRIQH
jgi:hypothetical protein